MRQFAMRVMIAGGMVSVSALWVGGAPAQSLSGSANVAARSTGGAANADPARPTAGEIVARLLEKNKERSAALEHYESERTYRVEYTGTGGEHRAEIQVHAEYLRPDQKQLTVVSESGSKFICEKVLRRLVESEQEATAQSNRMQTTLGPENYDARVGGRRDGYDGGRAGARVGAAGDAEGGQQIHLSRQGVGQRGRLCRGPHPGRAGEEPVVVDLTGPASSRFMCGAGTYGCRRKTSPPAMYVSAARQR